MFWLFEIINIPKKYLIKIINGNNRLWIVMISIKSGIIIVFKRLNTFLVELMIKSKIPNFDKSIVAGGDD
jgi:hypothetical protein